MFEQPKVDLLSKMLFIIVIALLYLSNNAFAKNQFTKNYTKDKNYFACAGSYNVQQCRCYQSSLNCTVPNMQPERNRFKPDDKNVYSQWKIKPNTELKDGFGVVRGVLRDKHVQINYGMRKMIDNIPHVYVFAETLKNGDIASGWIVEKQLINSPLPMPTLKHDVSEVKFDTTAYQIKRGMPKEYEGIKIRANSTSPKNEAIADYFERPNGVINLIYALPGNGGLSCDTFIINDKLHFYKATNVAPISIPTYLPRSKEQIGSLKFIFGKMAGSYGWIPEEVLIKK